MAAMLVERNNEDGVIECEVVYTDDHVLPPVRKLFTAEGRQALRDLTKHAMVKLDATPLCRDCGKKADYVTYLDTYICNDCAEIRRDEDPGDQDWESYTKFADIH